MEKHKGKALSTFIDARQQLSVSSCHREHYVITRSLGDSFALLGTGW